MRIKRILIELDVQEAEQPHATEVVFSDGRWLANGPMFPRVQSALVAIWGLCRERIASPLQGHDPKERD